MSADFAFHRNNSQSRKSITKDTWSDLHVKALEGSEPLDKEIE